MEFILLFIRITCLSRIHLRVITRSHFLCYKHVPHQICVHFLVCHQNYKPILSRFIIIIEFSVLHEIFTHNAVRYMHNLIKSMHFKPILSFLPSHDVNQQLTHFTVSEIVLLTTVSSSYRMKMRWDVKGSFCGYKPATHLPTNYIPYATWLMMW